MKLTRKLVLAKAKASDLDSVKKLNCCVNSISSLSPLAGCLSLCELYLRRNTVQSLAELCHLRPLPRLKVLWLAENPCCGTEANKYRLTVLRCLPRLHKLDNQVVTEEELSLALAHGDDITTPPGTVQDQLSTNGMADLDTENDPLHYNMEETNKIREQLGMKPLARDKFASLSSPVTKEAKLPFKKAHTLEAVLLLMKDLDGEELQIVHTVAQNRLQICTVT
ncbi:hypothetical protein CRUP_015864 [Coryphaenoides rupestris]|nr:hypothetical protein CRUP_015864 [Coryphaenoides rupestris]